MEKRLVWGGNWHYNKNFFHSLTFFSISYKLALSPNTINWKNTQSAQKRLSWDAKEQRYQEEMFIIP